MTTMEGSTIGSLVQLRFWQHIQNGTLTVLPDLGGESLGIPIKRVFTSVVGCVELAAVERRAKSAARAHELDDARFTLLLIGWSILSWAIALRIGLHVARWVIGS